MSNRNESRADGIRQLMDLLKENTSLPLRENSEDDVYEFTTTLEVGTEGVEDIAGSYGDFVVAWITVTPEDWQNNNMDESQVVAKAKQKCAALLQSTGSDMSVLTDHLSQFEPNGDPDSIDPDVDKSQPAIYFVAWEQPGYDVEESAEFDGQSEQHSNGELYNGISSMPGKANARVRYTPAKAGDNPMALEDISLVKSFREYVRETEERVDELSPDLRARYRQKAFKSQDDAEANMDLLTSNPEWDPNGEHMPANAKIAGKREAGIKKSYDPEPPQGAFHADYDTQNGYYNIKNRETGEVVATNVANSGGAAMQAADNWNNRTPN